MANTQDEDMYLFQGGLDQTPGAFAGQDFDNFLSNSPVAQNDDLLQAGYLNPSDLSINKEKNQNLRFSSNTRSSTSSASSSSSSTSPRYHNRNISTASTASPNTTKQDTWGSGINGLSMPATEQFFEDASMSGFDPDFETSNQQMASAFDFETAASTPSGYDTTSTSMNLAPASRPFRHGANMASLSKGKTASPRLPAGQTQFYFASREASPLNAMLPTTQAPSPWTKHSPSSGLEETFNHMGMNGDSPGNATFTPNLSMHFGSNPFTYDPESTGTPSSFTKEISSPPSTILSADGAPQLTVQPTSLKSRVETQIPIKMTLFPLPPGARKLRLPTHTVSKPKFLAKPEVDRSPEVLELFTSLVCTSAMQDRARLERALARARGDDLANYTRPSPASSSGSTSSKDDDDKPLNGGEVKICSGCIQRERKRASRKKQKKPEEEELFQKDEEKRVIVFNTSEIKDWVEVTKDNQPSGEHVPTPPPGAMQVVQPKSIACYCRHQNEKMGFQVIFTIKDFRDKVIAQAMTNSIMITDDHKTHNAPPTMPASTMSSLPSAPHLPGAGVFATAGMDMQNGTPPSKLFKQSFSTTDLHGLQHNFNPQFPMAPSSSPFAIPSAVSAASAATSTTMTPRNLSRPASPSGPSGPTSKRRKQSGSGKLPSGLTMTRLDTSQTQQQSATVPNTAASSPYAPHMPSFMSQADRPYAVPTSRMNHYGTSPPTPNGNDNAFNGQVNRSYSMENLPRQALMSAPSSRQPSRPGSPRSTRDSFGQSDSSFPQAVNNQLMGQQPSRRPTPTIHKLVPAEGSINGGTEVTLLGNGFYQGLEVMFGDTEATTTTFWGEKCLNCIAPPAVQPGIVAVVFKHDHHLYSATQPQAHSRPSVFTYIDDREIEMLRLALKTIGKQLGTDDPYAAAQHLLQQGQNQPQQGGYHPSSNFIGGHQRHSSNLQSRHSDMLELENGVLNMLRYASKRWHINTLRLDLCRPNGLSLLHLAASMGMMRLVVALTSLGADANAPDKNGNTPMHHAAMYGHENIVYRLRLVGADHRIRSLRNFTAADLATTLQAYQATVRPYQHSRSRSAGATSFKSQSRDTSSTSLASFWETKSIGYEDFDSENSDSESNSSEVSEVGCPVEPAQSVVASEPASVNIRAPSRKSSEQHGLAGPVMAEGNANTTMEQPNSPSAFIAAWRQLLNVTQLQQQQLAEQIQNFQDTTHWTIPNLPTLPENQAHTMMRRVSQLFPQRQSTASEQSSAPQKEGWWENLRHASSASTAAPPSYDDLYPGRKDSTTDLELKKASALQAAADAAADNHFEGTITSSASSTKSLETPSLRGLQERLPIERVGFMQDRKLFFVWIPLLAVVLALMLRSSPVWEYIPSSHDVMSMNMHREVVEIE